MAAFFAKSHMHIFHRLVTSNWLLENSSRSWLHKRATHTEPNLKIVKNELTKLKHFLTETILRQDFSAR